MYPESRRFMRARAPACLGARRQAPAKYSGHVRHPAQATAPQRAALRTAAHPCASVAHLLRHRDDHRHLRHVARRSARTHADPLRRGRSSRTQPEAPRIRMHDEGRSPIPPETANAPMHATNSSSNRRSLACRQTGRQLDPPSAPISLSRYAWRGRPGLFARRSRKNAKLGAVSEARLNLLAARSTT